MSAITGSEIEAVLRDHGLLETGSDVIVTPLAGGVSSEIWKVEAGGRTFCVKQALERLKVEADWYAPLERNVYEARWNDVANRVAPGTAPRVRCRDDERMFFIMDYLDPLTYELWKSRLLAGRAHTGDAANVGRTLCRIHSATAGDPEVSARFPGTDIFHAIRLEPYLLATAIRHPDLAARLEALSLRTSQTRKAMIHGDVSPKNILIGPTRPVLLDAECACIGDPAFDLAFCLNHMLLKCLARPPAALLYLDCFDALCAAYLQGVDWEEPAALEERATALLPALFLARVDGKSPVEYITTNTDRDKVRRCARRLIQDPPSGLGEIALSWREELR
ncbi:MAG: aminoglycoside phosphotransferase family protein [Arenicellales bacterium]